MYIRFNLLSLIIIYPALSLFSFSATASEKLEEPSAKRICLIKHDIDQNFWKHEYRNYNEQKKKQDNELNAAQPGSKNIGSTLFFVDTVDKLEVGYGLLAKDEENRFASLTLPIQIYNKLSTIGVVLKKVVSFYNGNKPSTNDSNIFIPHFSYIIQWKKESNPVLVPAGVLRDKFDKSVIFISGGNSSDALKLHALLEVFYNDIYKKSAEQEITVWSGKTVTLSNIGNTLHTESIFINILKDDPTLITKNLGQIFKENESLREKGDKPNFLGIIIDTFSWFNMCNDCRQDYCSEKNTIWNNILKRIEEPIEKAGFNIPIKPIGKLLRILFLENYGTGIEKLEGLRGGADFYTNGWDFLVLNNKRKILATCCSEGETLQKEIEKKITDSIIEAVKEKPLEFWKRSNRQQLTKFVFVSQQKDKSLQRFSIDAFNALFEKFSEEDVIKLAKIFNEKENGPYEAAYNKLYYLIESKRNFSKDDNMFYIALTNNNVELNSEGVKYLFKEISLKFLIESLKDKNFDKIKNITLVIAKYFCMGNKEVQITPLNFQLAVDMILNDHKAICEPLWKDACKKLKFFTLASSCNGLKT